MMINPKDLTNEELEYVIKTGKIPPKYAMATAQPPVETNKVTELIQ